MWAKKSISISLFPPPWGNLFSTWAPPGSTDHGQATPPLAVKKWCTPLPQTETLGETFRILTSRVLRPPSNQDLRSWNYRKVEKSQWDPHGTPVEILDIPGNVFPTFTSIFSRATLLVSDMVFPGSMQVKPLESYELIEPIKRLLESLLALLWHFLNLLLKGDFPRNFEIFK